MDLDDIDLGFIRPRTPVDWSMAYCQSQLYVDYMKSKYGADSVAKMLDAYRDGLDTDEAVKRACGVEKTAFEKGYRAFLDETVKAMGGKPAAKQRSIQRAEGRPREEAGRSRHDGGVGRGVPEPPRRTPRPGSWPRRCWTRRKTSRGRRYVHVAAAHQAGDDKQELELLESALDRADPDVEVLQALAKIYYDASEFGKAAEVCELGRKAEPYDSRLAEAAGPQSTPRPTTRTSRSAC